MNNEPLPIEQLEGLTSAERDLIAFVRLGRPGYYQSTAGKATTHDRSQHGYGLRDRRIEILDTHAELREEEIGVNSLEFYAQRDHLRKAWAVIGKLIALGAIRVNVGEDPEATMEVLSMLVLYVAAELTDEFS